MKTIGLIFALLLATAVQAQEKQQTVEEGCQQLLQAYSQLDVKASQANLVDGIQKGIVQVCKKLIELEKVSAAPEPTPVEEVK